MQFIDPDSETEIDKKKVAGLILVGIFGVFAIAMTVSALFGGHAAAPGADPAGPAADNSSRFYYAPTANQTITISTRCIDGLACTAVAPVTLRNATKLTVNVTPTPTPKPFDEYASGIRNLSQLFTIHRENVTGEKDMTVKITVYGFKETNQIEWYSDYWGEWVYQHADPGQTYVFVYLVEYLDGTELEDDSRPWYYGPNLFRLQVGDYLYKQDDDFNPVLQVREMEGVKGYTGIRGLRAFGYKIVWNPRSHNTTAELDPYMHLGTSNSKDGYLVFKVPKNSDPKDMTLVGNFGSFGSAGWRLA